MPPGPVTLFLTHVSALLGTLLTRVTTLGDPAPRLGDPSTRRLRRRLIGLADTIRAILAAPFTGPTRPARTPRPRFLAAVQTVPEPDPDARPPQAKPDRLPTHYRWLTALFPEFLPDRHQLEDRLREPEVKAAIAADPRLARAIRKLAWMLGVQRSLIPPAPPRGQVLLVVGSSVAQARADYTAALKVMAPEEILRRWCMFPDDPWQQTVRARAHDKRHNHDRRPVWLGPRLKAPELQPIHIPFRE
jgi:hypothetical protein